MLRISTRAAKLTSEIGCFTTFIIMLVSIVIVRKTKKYSTENNQFDSPAISLYNIGRGWHPLSLVVCCMTAAIIIFEQATVEKPYTSISSTFFIDNTLLFISYLSSTILCIISASKNKDNEEKDIEKPMIEQSEEDEEGEEIDFSGHLRTLITAGCLLTIFTFILIVSNIFIYYFI